MCCSQEMESKYGICFDQIRENFGYGFETTIQGFLLSHNILVVEDKDFGRKFLDFLEEADKNGLIMPGGNLAS